MISVAEGFCPSAGADQGAVPRSLRPEMQKARPKPGFRAATLARTRSRVPESHQRARERTWKTSKLSSATCHQRYWSPRKAVIESIAFLKSGFFAEISL